MKKINFLFLGLAIATTLSLASIGIAIAEESILGIILAIVATVLITGFSFMLKKRMREANKL
ncbi:MAG TPA: YlaF family protein [Bacillus bacterium]|nr:YlaF family protein [Bacillus sp. (in: firmicutes)]